MIRSTITFVMFLVVSNSAFSDYLLKNATVTRITSTNWNEKTFTVTHSGGTGVCAGSGVSFPEEYSQSAIAYSLSFSTAMSAYLHGKKIDVYNYGDKSLHGSVCHGASFIEIHD